MGRSDRESVVNAAGYFDLLLVCSAPVLTDALSERFNISPAVASFKLLCRTSNPMNL